ncbi:unnamed protein product (macronuclear) [Paramecium tetraurelia]|uniref:Protein kinase domain-containing protein n=1 Tax=Paramecium tetraurelia TaxID=5888 RepID=A0D4C7_PARTE|nr:uncharacterized protein GSPATT00013360001 [Paramecium tetraurelia]CAK77894.1 unnamed protein product [Paramecium tetraurelia]|eukprot:XP_001445291.1 hypothetical protein (macronuclear) [Paramecium tetraurelia strain d4-2]
MHMEGQKQFFLFEYIEESQFLDQKIKDYSKIQRSFQYPEIQSYLKNLLLALYQLHKNQMPGRVFSTFNIVVQPNYKIVLMDFGFEPQIEQNYLDILAPPEYLKKIIDKENANQTDYKFDLKFDSWLLGAFLYHLIKFQSINQVKVNNNDVRFKYDKKEEFYEYLKNIQYIPCQTSRYKNTLLSLVQGLLTCDPKERLSFLQIYQHPFIQDLQLQGQQEYIQFYSQCQYIRELKQDAFNTGSFISPVCQFPKKLEMIDSVSIFSPKEEQPQKKKIQIISATSIYKPQTNLPDYLVVVMNTSQFSDPSHYHYWFQIQLDCLRCQLLASAADRIAIFFKSANSFELVYAYIIKKMHLLILRDMNNYLKSELYQNQPNRNWQIFLNQHQKDLISTEQINLYLIELKQELLTILQRHCETLRKENSSLPELIKLPLNDVQDSNDYFLNGYQDAIQMLYQHINQLITQNQLFKLEELQSFKKLIYFCVDINISFQSQTFKEQFQQLTYNNQEVQPKDIITFLGITNKFG